MGREDEREAKGGQRERKRGKGKEGWREGFGAKRQKKDLEKRDMEKQKQRY